MDTIENHALALPTEKLAATADPIRLHAGLLSYEQTVPCRLVHKRAVAEVLVSDVVRVDEDTLVVGVQLPRAHACHGDGAPVYDGILVGEAIRQAALVATHAHLGVPGDHAFVLGDLDLRVVDPEVLRVGCAPAKLALALHLAGRFHRRGAMCGAEAELALAVDGRASHTARVAWRFRSAAVERALRARARAALPTAIAVDAPVPAAAHLVGKERARNVVIGAPHAVDARSFAAPVVVDATHPSYFDSDADHVPETLLLEAFRQLAVAGVAEVCDVSPFELMIDALATRFVYAAELDAPLALEAHVDLDAATAIERGPVGVTLRLVQFDRALADARITLRGVP